MKNQVMVFTEDDALLSQLKEAATGSPFTFIRNPRIDIELEGHVIICDPDAYRKKKLNTMEKNKLFMVSDKSDEENMKLVVDEGLMHMVGRNENVFGQEILAHLKKSSAQKIWGLQNTLDDDSEVKVLSLSDSKHTDELILDVLNHFDFKDYFSSPSEYIRVMANELVSNSLYKGPNKRRSEQGLDAHDRKAPVHLKGSDLVQVTLGMDQKGVALSVQDSFGGLDYNTLIASLKRSFAEKTAMDKKDGAGLGLYITFLHSNQFIVNHRANFRTEVICIIDKNKRYKNYKQRIRSFHYFEEVLGEKTNNK